MATSHELLVELPPPAALRDRVLSLWVHQPGSATSRRVVPDGSARLVCRVGAPAEIRRPAVPVVENVSAGELVVGARLRPDAHWADGPGTLLDDLASRLAAPDSPRSALRALARYLAGSPLVVPNGDPLIARSVGALLSDPRWKLDDLARQSSLSTRQWHRRFVAATGTGPKALQRQLRFQLLLRQVQMAVREPADDAALAEMAVKAGYWDQAHLTNECRRLTGRPLGSFVRETMARCRHNHDHAAGFAHIAT